MAVGACNIMIVMREGDVAGRLQKLLVNLGHRVAEVSASGGHALRSAAIRNFDLVIVSGNLPDMTGLNFALDMLNLKDVSVILITTESEKVYIDSKFQDSDITCLVRPVPRMVLQNAVSTLWKYRCRISSLQKDRDRLQETLDRRAAVARAKGVLMEKRGLSEQEAYRLMQKTSMDTGVPVKEIAHNVMESNGEELCRY